MAMERSIDWPIFMRYAKSPWVSPSGKRTKSYGKWPFIVDLPIKNGDLPDLWQLAEGKFVIYSEIETMK